MKFLYQYRTPDNEKHDGVIRAADREAAYALLKQQGIKPCRFAEAPGVLNKLFGKGKRWLAIGVLAVLCGVLAVIVMRDDGNAVGLDATLDSPLRRQPLGDAAVIDQGIRTGWAEVFDLEGERFLASFAIPGVPAGQRSTTEGEIRKALETPVRRSPNDGIEARQIRAMVEGMKDELREYLADEGTIADYGKELVQRQEQEISYYNRVKTELETAVKSKIEKREIEELWECENSKLRKMGIKLIPLPN